MEQSARKIQIIILAAGGLLFFALAAAHYFSPISRRLAANSDVELVLLNKERPMLFVYRSFSKTVNAVQLPGGAGRGGSAYQRAGKILNFFSGGYAPSPEDPAYIEIQAPDLGAFEELVNNWRARPALLIGLARCLRGLKKNEATNLSGHDLALLALEVLRINSSNLIKEEFDKTRFFDQAPAAPAPVPAAVRLEVLNASGRKDLAALVTKYLRKKGFDVINFGTYGGVEETTKIVNCSDNIEAARRIRDILDLGALEIYSQSDKLAIVQVRIILGSDFDVTKTEKIERGMQ
jgi:hypothetical protein